jgi:hypothetical protein
MIKKMKDFYHRITGGWMREMVRDIKKTTDSVNTKVDKLLARAQLDGEDYWFLREEKPKDQSPIESK